MSALFSRRIAELERRAPTRTQKDEAETLSGEEIDRRMHETLKLFRTTLGYEHQDRARLLTLEERLALARRDARPKPERWEDKWDPQLGCVRSRLVPYDKSPMVCARELEVQILERDGKIDPATAKELRKNIDAYKHYSHGKSVEVLALPTPIIIDDEESVADEALRKCPPRESLPLERQLELEKEDHQRDLAKRREWANALEKAGRRVPHGHSGLHELRDKVHADRVADLERRICERDAQQQADEHAE